MNTPPKAQTPAKESRFGPTAVLTPANVITILRLASTPLLIAMVAVWGPTWASVVVAFCVCATDGLDGWVARRYGATTSGAFLDPLADKAVVLGTFSVLAARGEIGWAPVVIIGVREISMSVYRSLMSRRSVSIPARRSAKLKTIVQDLTIGLCLLPPLVRHGTVLEAALWFATALTVATGLQYLINGRRMTASAPPSGGGTPGRADLHSPTGSV